MSKKLISFFVIIMFIFGSACGTEVEDSSSSVDVSAIENLENLDNSLDPYSCILDELVEVNESEGSIDGGNEALFLGKDRAFRYKSHLFENYDECYDEISIVDSYGGKSNVCLTPATMIRCGYAGDFSGFFALDVGLEDSIYIYSLRKITTNGIIEKSIELPFLDSDIFTSSVYVAADTQDNIFIMKRKSNENTYDIYVLNEEGEIQVNESITNKEFYCFKIFGDGRVAIVVGDSIDLTDGNKLTYYCFNKEKKEIELLCEYDSKYSFQGVNYYDSDTYINVGSQGVFLCDTNMDIIETLYLWENHDMRVSKVRDVSCFDDKVGVLYEDEVGVHYLVLQPTENVVEVQKIQLAVPQGNRSKYAAAVRLFNSTHPSCHIEMVDDFTETSLLTEISSGKGPVLISSELVDFVSHVNLWEPLDDVYGQLEISDELNEAAMKLGSIDGKLYGIVTDFAIETMVTGCDYPNWDYEQFISEIKKDGVESIAGSGYDEASVATFIFDHGVDDSYYIDSFSKETLFDTDEFRALMLLIKEKAYKENEDTFEEKRINDGKDLCTTIYVRKPEEMILYNKLFGEGINITGFPGNDGPLSFLHSMSTIAIRKNASKEEKEVAFAFANTLLSYDAQLSLSEDISAGMSVRKDVYEERINTVKEGTRAFLAVGNHGEMEIDEAPDNAANKELLDELIGKSTPGYFGEDKYKDILFEEFKRYFSDAITLDKLIDNLTSRVGIYIKEHQ